MNRGVINEKQLNLFKPPQTGAGTLEVKVRDGANSILNKLPNYGFAKESLSPFLQKIKKNGKFVNDEKGGYALENVFKGMNNFESLDGRYGAAANVLIKMNTSEILALYIGIQQKKPNLSSFSKSESQNFPEIISELVSAGYEYRAVQQMANQKKGFSEHPTYRGGLIERMRHVPEEDKNKFIKSLSIPYRNFGGTTEELRYEFRDPFESDERRYDRTGKTIWINKIVKLMEMVYKCNMSK